MMHTITKGHSAVYLTLSKRILNIKKDSPVLVAINGKDGSGKTTLADNFAKFLASRTKREIVRISIDDFMNNRTIRYTPSGSAGQGCYRYTFNFEGFIGNVLTPLQAEGSWRYRTKIFDHTTDSPSLSPIKQASSDTIVVVDGVFLYKKELVHYWDLKILLDTDDEVAIERGARRDTKRLGSYEAARRKYIDRYIASQTIYYREESPAKRANIIVDNNDFTSPFIKSQMLAME